jgi:uncharacterized protein (TIGR02996 family)
MPTLAQQTEDALMRAVIDHPEDADRKLVLADFLDDQGREAEARAYRWCVETGRHPYKYPGLDLWLWLNNAAWDDTGNAARAVLPKHLWEFFFKKRRWGQTTFPEIMLALAEALAEGG